ncbi:TonB-linked SusC/RagA family outer membrane protein [Pedobacter sp. AK017]|uniref:SusC/RagA family TonB-linked outer membrane protein n=1 Tax=Pedobacter sp. AK017 TaxID=2723073 RepID=UPI001613EC89|nr:SusC/RagA family TonB-linked outer membrane protein [Pedobacter sp. AK017]MBB5440096.1 TonB-linked SusC/RagA family outer membrane protein [Pedobacter sp. AK017]
MYKYIIVLLLATTTGKGYAQHIPKQKPLKQDSSKLQKDTIKLKEVVINTGYYQTPKERATGSFDHIDNLLINRSTGSNIISRLEGISSSLHFDRRSNTRETVNAPSLRVRGLSTINSNEAPLIVVDNFPYEGDINNINPNDVESVTILKDAAAASIWGARAGNGVIVITTKQGKYHQKNSININSNVTIGNKPNLYYNQRWLPSQTVMGFEKELFDKNTYAQLPETPLPAYVELLFKKKAGTISDADFNTQETLMKNTDSRTEALKSLYQQSINRQYALSINGGEKTYRYYLSLGYDQNRAYLIGNQGKRLNLNLQNTFKPLQNLEINGAVIYTRQNNQNNGLTLSSFTNRSPSGISPYTRFEDENGNALAIPYQLRQAYVDLAPASKLLDWNYRPLDEIRLSDKTFGSTELRLNGGLKYSFFKHFNANLTYQYIQNNGFGQSYYPKESYYVRNLVNRFTQTDGTQIIPYNAILSGNGKAETLTHSGRLQLSYQQEFQNLHQVTALAGTEIRQHTENYLPGFTLYNYDPEVLTGTTLFDYTKKYPQRPAGSASIPQPPYQLSEYADRYLSYFSNVAYTYNKKYTISGSLRWDGSNLFGVKTNQKGVPLWSAGTSWEISKEPFYTLHNLLPYLRLRATYGSAGNVNKTVTTYPVISYTSNTQTGLPETTIRSAGNPALRWELVKTLNLGLDAGSKNERIRGSIEYYVKKASDLIGEKFMAPSTGIIPGISLLIVNQVNYANMRTKGVDVQLSTQNLTGKLKWESNFLFSHVKNTITNYSGNTALPTSFYFNTTAPLQTGKSRDVIYWMPWAGLNPQTGKPLIPGQEPVLVENYRAYLDNYQPNQLLSGLTVPPYFGSIRNTISYKNLQLGAVVSFKAGYLFRRETFYPGQEYIDPPNYHADYFKRWKQPGDEQQTDVPVAGPADTYLGQLYGSSAALISKGDHIRLQDINLSYTLANPKIKFYAYARDLGILWRANKQGLDPDMPTAAYPSPTSYALGLAIAF